MILDWSKLPASASSRRKLEDLLKWKAEYSKNENKVFIRKTFQYPIKRKHGMSTVSSQLLIAVSTTSEPEIIISANGKCGMGMKDFAIMSHAIEEAVTHLRILSHDSKTLETK